MKKLRAAMVAAVLALIATVSIPSMAGAHPAHPAAHNGPVAPSHPGYNACTNTYHVYSDLKYYQNVGDNSIRVSVTQEWYQDSSGNYCGYLSGRTRFDSNDCFGRGAENVNYVVDEIFTTSGTYLGGFGHTTNVTAGCNSGTTVETAKIYVPCGTTIQTWGVWVEDNGRWEGDAYSDGEDVGGYGNAHDICVN